MNLPFHDKYERASRFEREQKDLRNRTSGYGEDVTPSDVMEKGDGCAMLIAALITIVPVCLVVLGALAAVGYFFIVR